MTAIVAVELRPYNEIYLVADTRVSYNQTKFDRDFGVQKVIPMIGADSHSVGAIGFSGYLAPIKFIVHHLLIKKNITCYRSPFTIDQVVRNLQGFIQEGFNNMPGKYRNLGFVLMFVSIDTKRQSVFKDAEGNIIENPFRYPIYLSKMYLFQPKGTRIEVNSVERKIVIIGSGQVITPKLYPLLEDMVSFGHPYDGTPQFRSYLTGDIISSVFQNERISTVGGPYWIWEILDPKRQSRQYWQWGVDDSLGNPAIDIERKGDDFIITNTDTGEKRTILHILNWTKGVQGALL